MFKDSITKEELIDLPLKWFEGEIVVVDSYNKVKGVIAYLSKERVIGFDTETKPAFKKGVINSIALLQLSTQNKAFLFRLNKIGLPNEICEILSNPGIIKTGVAIHDDIKGLKTLNLFKPAEFVE